VTKAIAIVAHYDDPLIWAGGAIKRTRSLGWDWTVVATCLDEPTRREVFVDWCGSLDVRPVALSFRDHPDGGPFSRNDRETMRNAVLKAFDESGPDWIFAHSLDAEGEYGPHPNHAEAARIVATLCEEGVVEPRQVARFLYRRMHGEADLPAVAGLAASHYLQLDYDEMRWKVDWCKKAQELELRDPALAGRTWLERLIWPCPNPEAFVGEGLRLPSPFLEAPRGKRPRAGLRRQGPEE